MKPFEPYQEGILIRIKAIPRSSSNRMGTIQQGPCGPFIKIYVTCVPEKGRANDAIIRLLAKHCRLPQQSIQLIRGDTCPHKTFYIKGLSNWPPSKTGNP